MIKGLGYLKYLKLSLIGLGISFFTGFLGNSVNAGTLQTVGLSSLPSPYDNSYNLTFIKGGGLLSNFLGQSKSILAFNDGAFFWWATNGQPYFYDHGFQGFFRDYYTCDEFTGNVISPTNCSSHSITGEYQFIFKSFFSQVVPGDYAYYDYEGMDVGAYEYDNTINVCWSSHSIGRSVCFLQHSCSNRYGCASSNYGALVNSQNLQNLTYGSIAYSWIGYAPGQAGYDGGGNIDGESSTVSSPEITGNVMISSCTNQKALDWYNCNYYNERMCYSSYGNNTDILISGEVAPSFAIPGTDINTVWIDTRTYRRYGQTGDAMGYSEWFRYWRKAYEVFKANQDSVQNPFVGVPVSVFTLMGDVDVFGLPFTNESILEYCELAVYSDTIDLGDPYTGVAKSAVCNQSAIDILDCSINKNNPIGSSWQGITNRPGYDSPPVGSGGNENSSSNSGSSDSGDSSGNLKSYQDGRSFENTFFNSLSDNYKFPNGSGNGILPSYIIIALCCLIFFRFISH